MISALYVSIVSLLLKKQEAKSSFKKLKRALAKRVISVGKAMKMQMQHSFRRTERTSIWKSTGAIFVALKILTTSTTLVITTLHIARPSWSSLKSAHTVLTFVRQTRSSTNGSNSNTFSLWKTKSVSFRTSLHMSALLQRLKSAGMR